MATELDSVDGWRGMHEDAVRVNGELMKELNALRKKRHYVDTAFLAVIDHGYSFLVVQRGTGDVLVTVRHGTDDSYRRFFTEATADLAFVKAVETVYGSMSKAAE
jgi:hypothetical protein